MKIVVFFILVSFFLFGCRSKSVTLSATAERHADTLASLRSVATSSLDRVAVWETVTMRPDTNGTLQVVARDIVRVTETVAATVKDTIVKATTANETMMQERNEKETVTAAPVATRGNTAFVGLVWLGVAALVLVGAKYLLKLWTSRV